MSDAPLVELPDLCAASVVMTLQRVVGITASPFTLEEQAFRWPGEAWSVDFRLPPYKSRSDAAQWQAFGLKLKGTYGRFLMGDPAAKMPQGSVSGPAQVNGSNQTGNILAVTGLTPSTVGILKKGDYFQVGSGISSKLHFIVDDVTSDASGNASLTFEPALRYSPPDGSDVVFENPVGVFRMIENSFSWSTDPGKIYRMGFSAQEIVNLNA